MKKKILNAILHSIVDATCDAQLQLFVSMNRKRLVGQNMRNPNDIVDEFESLSPNGGVMNAGRCDKNDFFIEYNQSENAFDALS